MPLSQEDNILIASLEGETYLNEIRVLRDTMQWEGGHHQTKDIVSDCEAYVKHRICQLNKNREFLLQLTQIWLSLITASYCTEWWSLRLLELVGEELRDDHDIVLGAVGANWRELEFASQKLRSTPSILSKALQQQVNFTLTLVLSLHFLDPRIRPHPVFPFCSSYIIRPTS
jgi:hypothetical protein